MKKIIKLFYSILLYSILFYSIFNFQAGDQPVVNEVGPFVYREVRRKVGITKEADIIIYGRYTVQLSFTGP